MEYTPSPFVGNPEDHILVENGDLFDGTRDMFRDCFFDNAYDSVITGWCADNGCSLSINGVEILKSDPTKTFKG